MDTVGLMEELFSWWKISLKLEYFEKIQMSLNYRYIEYRNFSKIEDTL